jgi:hypothetical protein
VNFDCSLSFAFFVEIFNGCLEPFLGPLGSANHGARIRFVCEELEFFLPKRDVFDRNVVENPVLQIDSVPV